MKVAVIQMKSRCISGLQGYLPRGTEELLLSELQEMDRSLRKWLEEHHVFVSICPNEERETGKNPLYLRKLGMIERADRVIFFWDGLCEETKKLMEICGERGKKWEVVPFLEDFSL